MIQAFKNHSTFFFYIYSWTSVLEKAIRLEIPESVIRERSPSYQSSGENPSPIERLRSQSLNVEAILTDVNEELENSV